MNAAVPHVLLHGIVLEVAVAAVNLNGLIADVEAVFGGKQLCHAAQSDQVFVFVFEGQRGVSHHETGGHQLGRHVGQLKLQMLELVQRFVELFSRLHVLDAFVYARLGGT